MLRSKKDAPWRSSKLRIRMFAGATEELSFSGDNVEIYDNRRPLEMDSGNSMVRTKSAKRVIRVDALRK